MIRSPRRSQLGIVAAGLLVLLPCWWLPQIQSADLASHIYNAWLTTTVEQGEMDGLYLARQPTNVLFDWLLVKLLPVAGKAGAQRIAVSLCVLVMFWGTSSLLAAAAGRLPWHLVPIVAMFCYGYVFHAGFFNFYLSLGLCVLVLALIWTRPMRKWFLATPLVLIALVSHPLPVFWLFGVALYLALASALPMRHRLYLVAGCVCTILALRLAIDLTMRPRWDAYQVLLVTGADQTFVFDRAYMIIWVGLSLWLVALGVMLARRHGWAPVIRLVPLQLVCLNGLGILLIPTSVLPPGYHAHLGFVSERMSLAQGILVLLLFAHLPSSALRSGIAMVLSGVFFVMLFASHRKLSEMETSVEQAIAELPRGARVLSGLCWPGTRLNSAYHLLDRACVGQCYSYGNYEPASGQFRLRAMPGNRFAVTDIDRAYGFEYRDFIYRPADVAEFRVEGIAGAPVRIRRLEAGMQVLRPCSPVKDAAQQSPRVP